MAVGIDVGAVAGADAAAAKKSEDDLNGALFRFARDFLAAGGVLSLDDWSSMSPGTRTQFVAAQEFLRNHHHEVAARAHFAVAQQMAAEAQRGLVVPPSALRQMERDARPNPDGNSA